MVELIQEVLLPHTSGMCSWLFVMPGEAASWHLLCRAQHFAELGPPAT